jgi:hypothetical protein
MGETYRDNLKGIEANKTCRPRSWTNVPIQFLKLVTCFQKKLQVIPTEHTCFFRETTNKLPLNFNL